MLRIAMLSYHTCPLATLGGKDTGGMNVYVRELLIPDESQCRVLWTSRVWPGALIVEGEKGGTWRRAGHLLTVQPWRRLSRTQHQTVEAEAASMPLPRMDRPMKVRWEDR